MYYFRLGSFIEDCYISELHTGSLKARRYEDLCIRCSEIKDMAIHLQPVSMISWNLPTVTKTEQYTYCYYVNYTVS